MKKEIIKKYIKYFGMNAPVPCFKIMKLLVEMKENGTYQKSRNYHLRSMVAHVWDGQS